jgi:hypothetical protein
MKMRNKYKIYVFASVCASLGLIRSTEATNPGLDAVRKNLNPQTQRLTPTDVKNGQSNVCSTQFFGSDTNGMSQCGGCFNNCINKMQGNLTCCSTSCLNAVEAYLIAVYNGLGSGNASYAFGSAGVNDTGCKNNSSTPSTEQQLYKKIQANDVK